MPRVFDPERCLTLLIPLVRKAGDYIRTKVNYLDTVNTKGSRCDLVTEADKAVEDLLVSSLQKEYPHHKFIGEETTSLTGGKAKFTDDPTWIIDPIDGTMNFVHGYPHVAISIGLAVKKEIVLGLIYNPFYDLLYTAVKGKGSFCNGKPIGVSEEKDISKALMLAEVGSSRDPTKVNSLMNNLKYIIDNCHGLRLQGSAALNMCSVASGAAEAYFEYGIHCWDMAAGYLIVTEAGGVCVDPEGGPLNIMNRRLICASSKEIQQALTQNLEHLQLESDE